MAKFNYTNQCPPDIRSRTKHILSNGEEVDFAGRKCSDTALKYMMKMYPGYFELTSEEDPPETDEDLDLDPEPDTDEEPEVDLEPEKTETAKPATGNGKRKGKRK